MPQPGPSKKIVAFVQNDKDKKKKYQNREAETARLLSDPHPHSTQKPALLDVVFGGIRVPPYSREKDKRSQIGAPPPDPRIPLSDSGSLPGRSGSSQPGLLNPLPLPPPAAAAAATSLRGQHLYGSWILGTSPKKGASWGSPSAHPEAQHPGQGILAPTDIFFANNSCNFPMTIKDRLTGVLQLGACLYLCVPRQKDGSA